MSSRARLFGLAVAGIALASMLDLPETYRPLAPLLWMMLLASFLAVAVAYSGTITGAPLLPSTVPRAPDLLLPLFVALSEFFCSAFSRIRWLA